MLSVLQISNNEEQREDLADDNLFVSRVESIEQAQQNLAGQEQFDCIVYDAAEGEDGLSLLRSLRSSGNTTPFIMVTNGEDESVIRNALRLGAQGVLPTGENTGEAIRLQLEKLFRSRSHRNSGPPKAETSLAEQLESIGKRTGMLEKKEREYDRLLVLMTSEFREQINTIDEFSRLLFEDLDEISSEDVRRYLNLIHKSSSRIKATLDNLRNYQRAQITELQMRHVNLSVIASSILEDLSASQPGRQTRTCVASDLKAYADESLLHLCLEYLLNTAWKSTLRKSFTEITFGRYRNDDEQVYYLSNNGEPLSEEEQRKAFTAFEETQLKLINDPDSASRDQNELHLAIVERIISRHGGRLWFEQDGGGSTTYLFTLGE